MTVRERGAHRDACWAGFLLSNFELAGPLYYVCFSHYKRLKDESTPMWPFTVHSTADRSCSRNAARLHTPYLADACREAQQHTPLTLPCPSDTAKSVKAAPMTLEMYRLAKGAHLLCLVLRRREDCVQACRKMGVFWGQWPDRSRKGRPFSKAQGSSEGALHWPLECWQGSPRGSCPN